MLHNRPVADASLVACPNCDLVQRVPNLAPGGSARCPRCDKELWRRREDSLNRTLALAVAAALLYVVANAVPFAEPNGLVGVTVAGTSRHSRDSTARGAR